MFVFGDLPPLTWREFTIPKKSGGVRIIEEPNAKLKEEQARILQYLYGCVRNGILEVSRLAHGFIPHRGTITSIPKHALQSKVLIGMDIHDFFPSFPIWRSQEKLSLSMSAPEVDYIMCCCTYKGTFPKEHFPQGSPVSPYLTNIGMVDVDRMIATFCKRNGMFFTRYADDMLFSVIPGMETSPEVRRLMKSEEPFEALFSGVEAILKDHLGLELSKDKSHVMWRYSTCKTEALGITFRQDNMGYNAPRKKRRLARAKLCNLYHKLQDQQWQFGYDDWKEWQSVNGLINYCNLVRSLSEDPIAWGCDPFVQMKFYNEIERHVGNAARTLQ